MLGKCSEDDDKLIWKVSKSWNFLMKFFYSSLKLDRGISFSLEGSVGLLGAFESRFFLLERLFGKNF